jgi:hypothetical protein
MKILCAWLLGEINWRIHRGDPVQHALNSLPGFFFINPLVYPLVASSRPGVHAHVVAIANDLAVVRTDEVLLGTTLTTFQPNSIPFKIELPDVINLDSSDTCDRSLDVAFFYVEYLVDSLRLTSRQVDIPRAVLGWTWLDCEDLPEPSFPNPEPNSELFLQGFVWDTTATWKNLIDADANLTNRTIPIHEGLVIDAIHAYRSRDYRRVLLYAAISIETATATKLGEIASSKGVKDPVYAFLSEKSRFAELLHEMPLYLMGRSLLVENEPLYQLAIKLYRTRNKIAHLGEPPQGERSYLEMNKEDALKAIECAMEVIKWLGERADFPLPKTRFVKMQVPLSEDHYGG